MPAPLSVDVELPRAHVRFEVDPPELAPWTAAAWHPFPRPPAGTTPDRVYRLEAAGSDRRIAMPHGEQICSPADAPPLWDQLMRRVLTAHLGGAILHAGLVVGQAGALLIMGPSGAGKSTMVGRLVAAGSRYGGDELVRVLSDGVQGVPRALELEDPGLAALADRHWSYDSPRPGGAYRGRYGHVSDRLHREPVPWARLRRAVVLDPARTGPAWEPLHGIPNDAWYTRPGWRDAQAVFRLTGVPFQRLRPGGVDETAAVLAAVVGEG